MEDSSPDYKQGYNDATENAKDGLAAVLRTHSTATGVGDVEVLSIGKAHEIFAGVFGVVAADEEFGPNPLEGV